jgi:hypothetical protein
VLAVSLVPDGEDKVLTPSARLAATIIVPVGPAAADNDSRADPRKRNAPPLEKRAFCNGRIQTVIIPSIRAMNPGEKKTFSNMALIDDRSDFDADCELLISSSEVSICG